MSESPTAELVVVRTCRTWAEAEPYALVLTAVGIACRLVADEAGVAIHVAAGDRARAERELFAYDRENRPRERAPRPAGVSFAALVGVLAYAAVLLFLFAAERRGAFALDWFHAGAAQAGLIAEGAWWRTVTALGLHGDFGHLAGNLAFGALFGLLLAQVVGAGLAWFAIVLGGGLGNAVNAVLQSPAHTSIGASTGIFAAVGLLSAYSQVAQAARWRRGLRRWAPVAAGVMLLAFLGFEGERTDIGAHVAGFAVGALLGFALALAPPGLLGARAQGLFAVLAAGLFALAWGVALSG